MRAAPNSPTKEIIATVLHIIMEKYGKIDLAYTAEETADLIKCSKSHFDKLSNEGHIASVHYPTKDSDGPRRYTLAQIIDYLSSREQEARKRA